MRRLICFTLFACIVADLPAQSKAPTARYATAPKLKAGQHDWPQWGGTSLRNNTPAGKDIPVTWHVKKGVNIKWKAKLGSVTYGAPIVANGRVFIGTNNGAEYLERFGTGIDAVDLGVLLCFDEQTGKFLWQYSARKLSAGRVNDWPMQGICANPLVDGDRLWVVTNRCEVVCLDTKGFRDGKNNGPWKKEPNNNRDEADIIWKFDMMKRLGVYPHNASSSSITTDGKRLFLVTSNGVDKTHRHLPSPTAPSFLCLDRDTGKVLWSDNSPGRNILHVQRGSPTYFDIGKQPQVLFPGGDGWLYSFDPRGDGKGKSKLLWKFDCNPKTSKWILGAAGTRNNLMGFATVYKNRVFIATGQDPEHGDGPGQLYCIDPLKKLDGSDVSPTLAVDKAGKPLKQHRLQFVDRKKGEREKPNPKSAMIWKFVGHDKNGDGKLDFEERMNRSVGMPVIKDDILYITDYGGIVHCLNANTGRQNWMYDMFAGAWSTGMLVDNKYYIADEDGDVAIFPHTADPKKALKRDKNGDPRPALGEVNCDNAIYVTPTVANGVLFIANKNTLYAIARPKKRAGTKK